jgi:hypothetical protein
MYRQFETFQNVPIKEQFSELDITDRKAVVEWSEDIIEDIESQQKKDTKTYEQLKQEKQEKKNPVNTKCKSLCNLDSNGKPLRGNKGIIVKTSSKDNESKDNESKDNESKDNESKDNESKKKSGPNLSEEYEVVSVPANKEVKPDKKAVTFAGIFSVLFIIAFILSLYWRKIDQHTIMLLSVASILVFVTFCTLANKYLFGVNSPNFSFNKLGHQCTLKMKLYISAILSGIILCIFIMFKQLVVNTFNSIKKVILNIF